MLPEQQQRILGYFIEEAKEHLSTIEQGLLNLKSTIKDPEMLNEVFRAAHSIKGGAAMLGLSSIQLTAHRLEDCFKVLKENLVQVDQKLESLFLGVSDTLKALLDHLQGPFGLTEDTANHIMSKAEPVFGWLNEHLEMLVHQTGDGVAARDIDSWQKRQNQVLQKLREMLHLFKQSATPETRQNLQECCSQLAQIGEELNCLPWSKLCRAASSAIAHQENTYLTLAKTVITDIKQALELVLTGREAEITISQQLELLIPPEIELLDITDSLIDDEAAIEKNLSAKNFEIASTDQEVAATTYNFAEFIAESQPIDFEPENSITSLSDISEQLSGDTDNFAEFIAESQPIDFEPENSITSLSDISEQLTGNTDNFAEFVAEAQPIDSELQDAITSLSELSQSFNDEEEEALSIKKFDTHGPEVGIAELSTLAQLFESDAPDFNDTWGIEEEIIESTPSSNKVEIDIGESETEDASNDFAELLSLEGDVAIDDSQFATAKEDLTIVQLFGDIFLEEEILETQKQQSIDASLDSSHNNLVDQNDLNITPIPENPTQEIDISKNIQNQQIQPLEQAKKVEKRIPQPADVYNLFTEPEKHNSVEGITSEVTPRIEANWILENLFTEEKEENKSPTIKIDDSEFGDFFDTPSAIKAEFSPATEDVSLWTLEDAKKQPQLQTPDEQDTAKGLEELLFAGADADDIFGDHQQPALTSATDFELEDLDIDFSEEQQQFDLMLLANVDDDLFADLATSSSTISSPEDIGNFSQPPEALELTPEFTDPPTEVSQVNLPQPLIGQEFSWLGVIDHGSHEDLTVTNSNDPAPDNPAIPIVIPQQKLLDDPFSTTIQADITFTDASESKTSQIYLELADIEVIANLVESLESAETIVSETGEEPDCNVLATTISPTQEATEEDDYTAAVPDVENTVVAPTQKAPEIDVAEEKAFADLDDLLKEEVASDINDSVISEVEFAALEELLAFDEEQDLPVAEQVVYDDSKTAISKPTLSPEIENEFKELEGMVGGAVTSGTVSLTGGRSSGWSASRFEQLMKVPVKHLDDLSNLVGELVVNRNTLEQDQERLRQSLDNLLHQVHQLSDVGARMQELYERSLLEASLLASRKNSGFSSPDTDRGFSELEMDRFTPFHSLSQEMIELIVRVRESASDIDFISEETERVARQFRQVTGHLQEGLTKARMEPFSQATELLPRGVRDNSIKYGKQVELVIHGRDTLIDKMILEHLKTPLNHLLNNAIAHGIETPQERQAKRKPSVGTITVRAFHQGNQTIISVSDDGAGIDSERVKTKAIKVGLITPAEAKTMSHIDVYDLLFQPGFTTKDQADDLAGRGVGLDVVCTKIREIRGTITIDSILGQGTTFTIRLPLTLSICKALFCVSDKARVAFPMDGVEDTLDIPVKNIQEGADGQKFIYWRDQVLPFKPLKELLTFNRQLSRGNVYGGNRDDDMISVIIVRSSTTFVALQVDQVLSEQEIVIKQFEGPAPKPVGVAGATVLGDGRIMPIADVLEIIDIFQGRTSKHSNVSILNQKATPNVPEASAVKIDPTVLIVDDSITVRELLSLTFNKAGYRVEQARDGQEAWDKLRSGLPCDLVFCDIEMPRCDGLELLSRIQKDTNLNHLPIAMLTSRGADKHKQMAITLGASGYFTKPYLEEALLEAASRMLKGEKLINSTSNV